ncbi:ribosomal protein S5 domain 2-like protein [Cantharellus anzutake]|uniref:ribosomal protein S5 domain 2-like protein n=1 Tax=Cantharellus anzutake TaxID=1750568 RepID=UPI001905A589|nr:ribosomal protein S5 domain 2-like protein [Cantharellus anzutake]KAF8343054.1 ribosomal protein S5 domain 2-like protein [Cantharellus anzutake]
MPSITDSTLDSFITTSRTPPRPLATSTNIIDRDSTFIAYIFRATSRTQAASCVSHVRHVMHADRPATHEMSAWRCVMLKHGKTGLDGPDDFEEVMGHDDDGETYGSSRVLGVMEKEGVLDAVVVCSRWYGGTMLGPVRFAHIEKCALEVCHAFKTIEQIEDCIIELKSYDETLAKLRAEIATLQGTPPPQLTPTDYKAALLTPPDLAKAQRLLNARRSAVDGLQRTLELKKQAANTSPDP